MKNITKYTLLVLFAFVASIVIYEYIEANKPVNSLDNVLTVQNNLEKNIFSDTSNYTLENPKIIVNPYGNSPLTALVIFETKDLTTPTVTIKGKDGAKDITNTFTPSKVHILPIYGLYAGYDNTIVIKASSISKTIHIKTDSLPSDFIKVTKVDTSNDDEFYFTTPEDKAYTAAYDCNGDVRWYLTGDYKWEVQRLNNGHLLISNDKLINKPYYTKGLMEIDLLGKIYFQYDIPSGYHHSVIEMDNGNFLVASNNFKDGSVEDYIVEVDRNSGDIIKEWNLHKLQNNNKENWLGLSSLLYNKSNNSITFTGKNNNMISNVDYKSGEINWIIADKKEVPKKYYKYILNGDLSLNAPTSLNVLDSGNIAFLNNKDGNIYLTICNIDTNNKSFEVVSEEKLGKSEDASISAFNEDDYVLTGDNYIKDNDLFIETDSKLYNTEKMSLYANDMYTSGAGVKLGKLGVTPTSKNISTLFHRNGKDVIKKYNLKFVKEPDRLVFTGTFNSSDDVKLILDNFLTKRTYDITISNTPYEHNVKGKVNVSKYINNEDIYGKFYIYIRINGVNYKLEKYVTF